MKPSTLGLWHLRRRPARAALLVLGLAVGASTVSVLLSLSWTMRDEMARQLRSTGTIARISTMSQAWTFAYAGLPVATASHREQDLPADTLARLGTVLPDGTVVAPKLLELVVGPDSQEALVVGVVLEAERQIRGYWQVQGSYPGAASEVLAGAQLAELWEVGPGDVITLFGKEYRVAGVLEETGHEEDGLLFMSLSELRRRTERPEGLTVVEVRAPVELGQQESWRRELTGLLPGSSVSLVRSVEEARLGLLENMRALVPLTTLIAVAAGCLLVAASQSSAVRERTREVGLLRAIGFRQKHVVQVFLVEVAALGLTAGLLGYFGGVFAARLLLPLLDAAAATTVGWFPSLGVILGLGSLALSLLAGYLPARRAARTDPAEALRFL